MSESERIITDSDEIVWLKATRHSRTEKVHAVTYGVECSRCRCFQDYETRFCKDCGGRYMGPLPIFNKRSEKKFWRQHNG